MRAGFPRRLLRLQHHIIVLILLGRWLESRAKGRTTGPFAASSVQAKTARWCGRKATSTVPSFRSSRVSPPRPPARRCGRRRSSAEGSSAVERRCTPARRCRSQWARRRGDRGDLNTTGSFVSGHARRSRHRPAQSGDGPPRPCEQAASPAPSDQSAGSSCGRPRGRRDHLRPVVAPRPGAEGHARPSPRSSPSSTSPPLRDGPGDADREHGRDGTGSGSGHPRRGGEALENAENGGGGFVRNAAVILDKTGTLTRVKPAVADGAATRDLAPDDLSACGRRGGGLEHPIAGRSSSPPASDSRLSGGGGVRATRAAGPMRPSTGGWSSSQRPLPASEALTSLLGRRRSRRRPPSAGRPSSGVDGVRGGLIAIADPVKPESGGGD